ncbi:cobalamin binding intrinsic factor-like [Indicator indicator]|uniref:cobalamin binding intrinsic factor-like n=1 Tax=Indicator indicator TaxID=1002788 RepID=UPI0023DED835|nr:cobalamin binding intrinsic factor-like [Indicator indicator]
MLRVAVTIGVLLALLGGTVTHCCDEPQDLISSMLREMKKSIKAYPHPRFLLAMSLAGDNKSDIHDWLLQYLKEEAVEKAQDMHSGLVALDVLALLSSCQDPRQVEAKGKTVDLVSILQKKTDEEVVSILVNGVPKTTFFSVSLDALALCLVQGAGYETAAVVLAQQVLNTIKAAHVDTRAMMVQALVCTYNHTNQSCVKDLLGKTLSVVTNELLDEQERNGGMIGNIYSMGVALQALETSSKFYAPREWNCAQAFAVVHRHNYRQPVPIAQVLPALVDKPYLQAASMDCTARTRMSQDHCFSLPPSLETAQGHEACYSNITVHYCIVNKLQGKHFNYCIPVEVLPGSVLLQVLDLAKQKEPDIFSFKKKDYPTWGPMVVSIHGLAANDTNRTFWEFLSGKDALEEGVGTYKPHDMEHITANFTKGIW